MHDQIRKLLKALEAQREVLRRLEGTVEIERLAAERQLEADLMKRLEEVGAEFSEGFEASLTPAPPPLIIKPHK